ncbi:hypothetical protein [Stappia sp.]|uniref:hypothetical protein n=1 Tax=Stappia sp. TaxID=1870903 RepID=UPI003C7C3236
MQRRKPIFINAIAAFLVGGMVLSTAPGAQAEEEYVTAGKVLKELPPNEFVWFVGGIVEGLAYARFRKDTVAAGERVTTGSNCIRDWFHGNNQIILKISNTFRKYEEHTPWVVIAAMVKKECGE